MAFGALCLFDALCLVADKTLGFVSIRLNVSSNWAELRPPYVAIFFGCRYCILLALIGL